MYLWTTGLTEVALHYNSYLAPTLRDHNGNLNFLIGASAQTLSELCDSPMYNYNKWLRQRIRRIVMVYTYSCVLESSFNGIQFIIFKQ